FIDVGEFRGTGESEPSRYFYQNLGEAEYVVAVFQYMRLVGYPAEKISILTTYNGQRALIRDVLDRRCAWHSFFGRPQAIATVDQYQGQQNDFVLLSLVRTRSVGHLRDLRRLTVALSRARLGLYVFGHRQVFESCFELQHAMKRLIANGDKLVVCPDERVLDKEHSEVDANRVTRTVENVEDMGRLVYAMIEQLVQQTADDGDSIDDSMDVSADEENNGDEHEDEENEHEDEHMDTADA
ncbi:hypothetical protein FB639_003590, partial [Coemansia asiatica]